LRCWECVGCLLRGNRGFAAEIVFLLILLLLLLFQCSPFFLDLCSFVDPDAEKQKSGCLLFQVLLQVFEGLERIVDFRRSQWTDVFVSLLVSPKKLLDQCCRLILCGPP